ncbi:DUF2849 domain-containing protein [Alphaproteobacteria bacterium KMM 3653]|uniref:DUF2849 domain-containing protein n=1 Tax=Harenicola maris TaxID=2841044 RepID=A0AAP2G2U0_9RHOB|nr:DUF2849 domain-containing protein [Harenicola maris]
MARKFSPSVVTANALLSGEVIYLSPENTWVTKLSQAQLYDEQEQAEAALAKASADHATAVGVYLAEAEAQANGPAPTHFREAFRAKGPSNYPHGKQAEG